jgi:hypothetical protein
MNASAAMDGFACARSRALMYAAVYRPFASSAWVCPRTQSRLSNPGADLQRKRAVVDDPYVARLAACLRHARTIASAK